MPRIHSWLSPQAASGSSGRQAATPVRPGVAGMCAAHSAARSPDSSFRRAQCWKILRLCCASWTGPSLCNTLILTGTSLGMSNSITLFVESLLPLAHPAPTHPTQHQAHQPGDMRRPVAAVMSGYARDARIASGTMHRALKDRRLQEAGPRSVGAALEMEPDRSRKRPSPASRPTGNVDRTWTACRRCQRCAAHEAPHTGDPGRGRSSPLCGPKPRHARWFHQVFGARSVVSRPRPRSGNTGRRPRAG